MSETSELNAQELAAWFAERPKWMQHAAHHLATSNALGESDVESLRRMCVAEANGEQFAFNSVLPEHLSTPAASSVLRLHSIDSVTNVNALQSRSPLTFGAAPICIVYGGNGSGKSGYVRLLKQAAGVRNARSLLADVFGQATAEQRATFHILENGVPDELQWNHAPLDRLRAIDIFDSDVASGLVTDDAEASIEPWPLALFTQITDLSRRVSAQIARVLDASLTALPPIPTIYMGTPTAKWYSALSADTTASDVELHTLWTGDLKTELSGLDTRLASPNPEVVAAELRNRARGLRRTLSDLVALWNAYSDTHLRAYLDARATAIETRRTADSEAERAFGNAPLTGVGSSPWRLLWNAAREYSTGLAYPNHPFPHVALGAVCVFCQQELAPPAQSRLQQFEEFVRGRLQEHARDSEARADGLHAAFPDVPPRDDVRGLLDASGVTDEDVRESLLLFVDQLAERSTNVREDVREPTALPSRNALIPLARRIRAILASARTHKRDAKPEERAKASARKLQLQAQQWASDQRPAIEAELHRLRANAKLEAAKGLTNPVALTKRKADLTETLITAAFAERFTKELRALSANRIRVQVVRTRSELGRIYHRLVLSSPRRVAAIGDVLSEGELRVVALAAFLADRHRDSPTPFIFDDPVSSLDHRYEEATAQRLVQLSTSRQVIVFTHRLSLVGYLRKYAARTSDATVTAISARIVGDVTAIPIELDKTDRAVNRLLNERVAEARKVLSAEPDRYDIYAKALCRDVRLLIERVVESDLISGIVTRFSPEVQTKNKIHRLARITGADCALVDELMTKYSRYEHSQPEEAPLMPPELAEIEADLVRLRAFIGEISSRSAT